MQWISQRLKYQAVLSSMEDLLYCVNHCQKTSWRQKWKRNEWKSRTKEICTWLWKDVCTSLWPNDVLSVIPFNHPKAREMSKKDLAKRMAAHKERKIKLKSPNYRFSTTRLCIRNIPKLFTEKELKKLYKDASGGGKIKQVIEPLAFWISLGQNSSEWSRSFKRNRFCRVYWARACTSGSQGNQQQSHLLQTGCSTYRGICSG